MVGKRRTGTVREHIEVLGKLEITGAVEAGATVRAHGFLTVRGALIGPLIIEVDGGVMVYGSLTGPLYRRGGVVMVGGMFSADVVEDEGDGAVCVALGSGVEVDGVIYRLTEDGLMRITGSSNDFNIEAGGPDTYMVRQPDGTFVRLVEESD